MVVLTWQARLAQEMSLVADGAQRTEDAGRWNSAKTRAHRELREDIRHAGEIYKTQLGRLVPQYIASKAHVAINPQHPRLVSELNEPAWLVSRKLDEHVPRGEHCTATRQAILREIATLGPIENGHRDPASDPVVADKLNNLARPAPDRPAFPALEKTFEASDVATLHRTLYQVQDTIAGKVLAGQAIYEQQAWDRPPALDPNSPWDARIEQIKGRMREADEVIAETASPEQKQILDAVRQEDTERSAGVEAFFGTTDMPANGAMRTALARAGRAPAQAGRAPAQAGRRRGRDEFEGEEAPATTHERPARRPRTEYRDANAVNMSDLPPGDTSNRPPLAELSAGRRRPPLDARRRDLNGRGD